MALRVAVNGFGRIGRMVLRAGLGNENMEFVAVNDLTDPATLAHLLKYDSVHGTLDADVSATENSLIVNGKEIANPVPIQKPGSQNKIEAILG